MNISLERYLLLWSDKDRPTKTIQFFRVMPYFLASLPRNQKSEENLYTKYIGKMWFSIIATTTPSIFSSELPLNFIKNKAVTTRSVPLSLFMSVCWPLVLVELSAYQLTSNISWPQFSSFFSCTHAIFTFSSLWNNYNSLPTQSQYIISSSSSLH